MGSKDNRILVSEFVKKYDFYKSDVARNSYAEGMVTSVYASILTKGYFLRNLVDKSTIEDGNGARHIDMLAAKINFVGVILALYTKLEIDKDSDGKPLLAEAYDSLTERGIIDVFRKKIGDKEMGELASVQEAVLDDFYQKNMTARAFAANVLEACADKVGIAAGFAVDKLDSLTRDEKRMDRLADIVRRGVAAMGDIAGKGK